ncbi:hypothetical protein [Sphaerochaeta sp. PS]|uniref:hypothetical protein n=1 Tax=Sphaerochaeta sp. PS TaxID=3076336 RepID=UPI0028A2E7B7|nr:hypothetical protein [Sphaerochaeta sp. PS]MDT4761743.1 hypothetical protein [Sphaerochaeta sp. PS]
MSKRISVFLVILLVVLSLLSAEESQPAQGTIQTPPVNLGQAQLEDTVGSLLEGTATSDGFFSLSFAPDFTFGKLSFQLALKLQGQATNNPVDLSFDFSDWALRPKTAEETTADYLFAALAQYSSFIRYIQWGERYEDIYIRYGKLAGITLGDGAILNGFFDWGVDSHATRPGLDVAIDGNLLHIPNAGFEFVTNDLFEPTLSAWRVYARPFYPYENSFFANMEVGVSYAENPSASFAEGSDDSHHTRKLIAIDLGIPLLKREFFNLAFFSDLLVQTPGANTPAPGIATRYGIWGHSKSFFIFNTSLTIPSFGTYYPDYFDSGFEALTAEDRENSVLEIGSMRIDALAGLNFTRLGAYLRANIRSDYSDGNFFNYKFLANARIDKRLFNIVSLDLSYEKLYPTSTDEAFFEGLSTLRNVDIEASAIIKVKPYSFTIGLSMIFDEQAKSTLVVDTAVRIAIL